MTSESALPIKTLHLTDQKLYNNFDLVLKVQVDANQKCIDKHAAILKFLIKLADFIATRYKVSPKT